MVITVSTLEGDKRSRHYEVIHQSKPTSGAVAVIVEVDPRKDTVVQVNAQGNTWDLETTSHTGTGNTDLEDAAVPWILLKDQITADFHSGQALENHNLIGLKFSVAAVTTSFEVLVAQKKLDERNS